MKLTYKQRENMWSKLHVLGIALIPIGFVFLVDKGLKSMHVVKPPFPWIEFGIIVGGMILYTIAESKLEDEFGFVFEQEKCGCGCIKSCCGGS